MFHFGHKVFFEVARQLSFSKAAEELFMSQPAISKQIKSLEAQYHVGLFERKGNSIALTVEGKLLLDYVRKVNTIERELDFEITAASDKQQAKGSLVIGASTTVALYVIPKVLSSFHRKYPNIHLRLINRNSENVLKALLEHEIDFGVTEGKSKITSARYKLFITDEVIPVCSAGSEWASHKKISLAQLKNIPMVLRERGSGTLAAVTEALAKCGIKINDLNTKIVLGGTEALKNFLLDDVCLGFLPLRSVAKELKAGELIRLQIPGLQIIREFYFVQRQGTENDKLHKLFIKIALEAYNKKL